MPSDAHPPIDTGLGLKRLGGDLDLFMEILNDFRIIHADFPKRFMKAFNDETGDTVYIAHTLKGAAGNISATLLHSHAESLEKACGSGTDRDTILNRFNLVDAALRDVLEFKFVPASPE